MKYSVFTVGTPNYTIEETVKKLKQYGYDAVEWRVADSLKEEPKELPPREGWYWSYNKSTVDVDSIVEKAPYIKEICEREEIEICALATYLPPWETEKIENVLKAAVIMNCPKIRTGMPGYNKNTNYNELFDKTIKAYKELEKLAKKYGVKINAEIHHGTLIPSASAAYRLVSNFDSKFIGVIYDPGNMVHEGFEQYKMGLELLGDYLDHVHLKNAAWEFNNGTWSCKWSPIKKGQVNMSELLTALKSIGYEGFLSFEDFSNEETTEEKLEGNIEYIKGLV